MTADSILGICIPAYKRPDQLWRAQSVIRSVEELAMPVFISDDSTDDTNMQPSNGFTPFIPISFTSGMRKSWN